MHGATGAVPSAVLQRTRGWSDDEWAAAVDGLVARGWLDPEGALTEAGAAHRQWVEDRTDALAARLWTPLDGDELEELRATGKAVSRALMAAGAF